MATVVNNLVLQNHVLCGMNWLKGHHIGFRDNKGQAGIPSGDYVKFGFNDQVNHSYIYVSQDGINWTQLAPSSGQDQFDFSNAVGFCQSADGKGHLVGNPVNYVRIAFVRDGNGHITGWSHETDNIDLPAPAGVDGSYVWRVEIKARVIDGTERLILWINSSVGQQGTNNVGRALMEVTANVTPSATSSFASLTGTAGSYTTIFDASTFSAPYNTTDYYTAWEEWFTGDVLSNGNICCWWGRNSNETVDEGNGGGPAPLDYYLLTYNGTTWSVGTKQQISIFDGTRGAVLCNAEQTNNGVVVMLRDASNGLVLHRVLNDGTYQTGRLAVAPIPAYTGQFAITRDESHVLVCYINQDNAGGDGGTAVVKWAHWDGTSWETYTDTSTFASGSPVGTNPAVLPGISSLSGCGENGGLVVSWVKDNNIGTPAASEYYWSGSIFVDLYSYTAAFSNLSVPLVISSMAVTWSGAPPIVSSDSGNESGTANVTTFNAQIGSPPNGSRIVGVITKDGSADFSSLPSGWTVASNTLQGTAIRSAVVWKNCDGTEGATIPFGVSSAESFVWHYWQIEAGTFDPASAPAVAVNAVATANNNPAAVTPIWGSANNLCICTLAQDTNSTAPSGYPSGYTTGQGTLRSTNTTTSDRTRLTWCRKTAVGSSEDPGAWTSSAVASVAYTILIRPATYTQQYTQSCVCSPVSSTTSLNRRAGKKSQSLPVATLAIRRLPGVKRVIASATTVLAKRRVFSKRTQTSTVTTSAKRQVGRKSSTTTTGSLPSTTRRTLLKRVLAVAATSQVKNRIATVRKPIVTAVSTLRRRIGAVRRPNIVTTTSMTSRVILGLITKSILIFENSVITVRRQVRTKKSPMTTGTTSVARRSSKRLATVITSTTSVLHPLIVGTHRLTITVVSSLSTVARRRVITAKSMIVTGAIPRLVRSVRMEKLSVVALTTSLKRAMRVVKAQITTTEVEFSAIGVKLLAITAATVSATISLRRRALSIRRSTATSSVGILRHLRVARAASLSVAMQLFKRPRITRAMSLPVVLFASRITQQSLHVLAQTLTSSTTALRRDIKVRWLSLTSLTPRVRKAVTATRVAVGRVVALPRKQVRPQPLSSTTTATGRLVKRAQLRARTLIGSLVSMLAERTVAQIYPLTFGRRHPANPWRGRLTHKAVPMEKLWTTLEKRTAEVLDIAVDWTDILSARGEIAIATVEWSIDPTHPGDATLAGIPYQPRLDGNVAKARVAAGNTTDTLFICKVTFRSGQTEIDKTLIKWIP